MNPTAAYLDSFARTTADVRVATIVKRNDDDTYDIRYVDTGSLDRAGISNPGDEFALKSRVNVSMVSNSRSVIGAQPVIQNRAPRVQRGLSGTTPTEQNEQFSKAAVTGIDPDPLVLERGGGGAEQIIMGIGLNEAANYVAAEGDAPILIDDEAPIVTPAKVTMTISADADSPLGEFDIEIAGVKVGKALRIIENSRVIGPYLYVTSQAWDAGFSVATQQLRKINLPDLAVLTTFTATTGPFTFPNGNTVEQDGTAIVWVHEGDSDPSNVRRIAIEDDAEISEDSIAPVLHEGGHVVVHEPGKFFLADAGLWEAEPPSANHLFTAGSTMHCVAVDGGDVYLAGTGFGMRRLDLATFTEQAVGLSAFRAVVIGANVWVARGTTVQKRDRNDLTVITTIAIGGNVGELCLVDGLLYALRYSGSDGIIVRIDPATDDSEDLIHLGVDVAHGMTTDGTHLYVVGEEDLRIRKVVAATGALAATSEPISLSVTEYAEQIRFVAI